MKLLYLFAFLISTFGLSQDIPQPIITINGVEPIVVNVPNKSKSEIYNSVKKWVIKSYNTPSEVIKADLVDELIRIEGYNSEMYIAKGLGTTLAMGVKYSLSIEIKEERYRLTFRIVDEYTDTMTKLLYPFSYNFKKADGSIKKGAEIKIETFNNSLANLNNSIYSSIVSESNEEW